MNAPHALKPSAAQRLAAFDEAGRQLRAQYAANDAAIEADLAKIKAKRDAFIGPRQPRKLAQSNTNAHYTHRDGLGAAALL